MPIVLLRHDANLMLLCALTAPSCGPKHRFVIWLSPIIGSDVVQARTIDTRSMAPNCVWTELVAPVVNALV